MSNVTITGSWIAGTEGNWTLTIPTRVTGYDGTEILPAGVYATGNLINSALSVSLPSSAGTLPADWQPVLEVVIYGGDHERYTLDVSAGDVDLGAIVLPPSSASLTVDYAAQVAAELGRIRDLTDPVLAGALFASFGRITSTDGTVLTGLGVLPAPTGVGVELVFTAAGLDDIRINGVSA